MSNQKRQFPYWSDVQPIQVKRQGVEGPHPGREFTQPRVYEEPAYQQDDGVERARELEINTGRAQQPTGGNEEDEEYDPLEAFMADINKEVAADKPVTRAKPNAKVECDEAADPAAEFMQARKSNPTAAMLAAAAAAAQSGYNSDEEVYATAKALDKGAELEYDSDDNPILDKGKKNVTPLEVVDHASMSYDEFAKDFYEEHAEVAALTQEQVSAARRQLDIRVAGFDVPKPITAFTHCGFDKTMMEAIKKAGYDRPTAIQSQALPAALSGRDVLGVAKTGSGKTAAYLLPMIVHIMDQAELERGQGPIGVILAPTRELAEQVHKEARKFSKAYALRVAAAFGGLSKHEQFKDLKAGSEVAVATPGRLIDLVKDKACTLQRVTYLVLDEADRMFDLGFEYQIRSIISQIRPDRQTLLFSATMPSKVERLVGDVLSSPVRITVGVTGIANEDVRQEIEVVAGDSAKAGWLAAKLQELIDEGEVIIFVSQKAKVEALVAQLSAAGVRAGGIHGDMDQFSRMAVLEEFRSSKLHVLVATDVAARGLDIRTIKTVVNVDAARDIETHIHRVGRTGRAGDKEGRAITLLTPGEANFAAQLVQSLTLAGQMVPPALHELAMKDAGFRKGTVRSKGGRGGGRGGRGRGRTAVGGAGLGFGPGGGGGGGGGGRGGSSFSLPGKSSGNSFVQLPGFAKSSSEYEAEPSATFAAASSGQVERQQASAAAGPGPGSMAAAAATAPPRTIASSSGGGTEVLKSFYSSRFGSSFVSSGTTGGDIGQTATVMAPKVARDRPLPPPPVPVTQRPVYNSSPQMPAQMAAFVRGFSAANAAPAAGGAASGFSGGTPAAARAGSGFSGGSYNNMPPPSNLPGSQNPSDAAAKAIAAAQAIAARLSQQHGGQPPQ